VKLEGSEDQRNGFENNHGDQNVVSTYVRNAPLASDSGVSPASMFGIRR
jgi:hypothetical protein